MGIILYVIFIYNHIYKTLFRMIPQNDKVPQIVGRNLLISSDCCLSEIMHYFTRGPWLPTALAYIHDANQCLFLGHRKPR